MRRAIALAVLALALTAGIAQAGPVGIGIGAYGGVSYPINQDDVTHGPLYGLRVPIKAIPMITVEPYYLTSHLGDGEETIAGVQYAREGFDHTGYGVNAILAMPLGLAFGFHPYAGIGSHKLERAGTPEIKETAYNFGLGMGINAIPKISLQIRGELNMVMIGTKSRKFANGTVGLTYSLSP
jgi:hypothetical protein